MNRKPDPYSDDDVIPSDDDLEMLPDYFEDEFYDEEIRLERETDSFD